MKEGEKPKLKIVHNMELERQKNIEELRKMYKKIADKEIKTEEDLKILEQIEFSLRQLLTN